MLACFVVAPANAVVSDFPPDIRAVRVALNGIPAPSIPLGVPVAIPANSIWDGPPVFGLDSPAVKEYAHAAELFAAQGLGFSAVFAGLCRLLRENPRAVRAPKAEVSHMFRGLIRWTRHGGKPVLQGCSDWPLHFIYGGYIAATFGHPTAVSAAYAKEQRDAFIPGNYFNLDDYGITRIGARWSLLAGRSFEQLERWVQPWISGQKSLDRLPALQFGHLPHGRLPTPALLHQVDVFVRRAL